MHCSRPATSGGDSREQAAVDVREPAEVNLGEVKDIGASWDAAMQRGDWQEAWRQTDRIEIPRRHAQRFPDFVPVAGQLKWNGTPLEGRSVLIRCEHGLGDTLQFIRFVPQVVRLAREVHLLVQPHLLALLRGAPGLGNVSNGWTNDSPPHDVEIEIMELPYALRADLHCMPPPYSPLRAQAPAGLNLPLPGTGLINVGLLWAASDWDRSRSVPLRAFAPLLSVPNVQFYSLQQGAAAHDDELAQWPIVSLSAHTENIPAAAAAMQALDLIITVDGMPAHLAASLGRPTWLLLKHHADWRWMNDRTDSPWYPTMRLFRQPRPGAWEHAITAAAAALSALGSPP